MSNKTLNPANKTDRQSIYALANQAQVHDAIDRITQTLTQGLERFPNARLNPILKAEGAIPYDHNLEQCPLFQQLISNLSAHGELILKKDTCLGVTNCFATLRRVEKPYA